MKLVEDTAENYYLISTDATALKLLPNAGVNLWKENEKNDF